ncbi:MAG: hypothetical protein M1820_008607 [Bogoriella megaspora]|nr:MAG: hypothetical protein M1820_008607 [Bogoriella megaspora]
MASLPSSKSFQEAVRSEEGPAPTSAPKIQEQKSAVTAGTGGTTTGGSAPAANANSGNTNAAKQTSGQSAKQGLVNSNQGQAAAPGGSGGGDGGDGGSGPPSGNNPLPQPGAPEFKWSCCQCGEYDIRMAVNYCPHCGHSFRDCPRDCFSY